MTMKTMRKEEVAMMLAKPGIVIRHRQDGVVERWTYVGWIPWKRVKAGLTVEEAIGRLIQKGWQTGRVTRVPCEANLRRWEEEGVAEAQDGCRVEIDGYCPHGWPSWLIVAGLV